MPCWGADAGFFFIVWWYKLRQPCRVGVQTQDTSVHVVTELQAVHTRNQGFIAGRGQGTYLFQSVLTDVVTHPASTCSVGTGALSPGLKWLGCEGDDFNPTLCWD
jgi:hypothetical protein